nr:protamine mP2 intermediate protein pmP2/26 [mice, Peptide Partial, 10 aa] [Mus sp.]
GQGQGLSPER